MRRWFEIRGLLFVGLVCVALTGCPLYVTVTLEPAYTQIGAGPAAGAVSMAMGENLDTARQWTVEVISSAPDAGESGETGWLSCDKSGPSKVSITYAENTTQTARSAAIRVRAWDDCGDEVTGSPALVYVAQAAANATPHTYQFVVEKDWLAMQDGIRLAATYYRPLPQANGEKFPAVLELLPYRKDDLFYLGDYEYGAYFAKHGYTIVRVDVRGTGSSEGSIPPCEYSETEIDDAVEVIDQLSKKDWANGSVGMYGVSWSGFNSLMTASRKPPALKAIIAAHASTDLYYNDVHYIDGVLHMDQYAQQIDVDNILPAPPGYKLDAQWRADRFDREPWVFTWFREQQDSAFWRDKSIKFKEPLEVPAYLVGGLLDGYRDFVSEVCETSNAPVIAEIGPWNHAWPEYGKPGPNYEWRQRALRWWDHWLKNVDNGVLDEPRLLTFVRDGHEPSLSMTETPGEWRWDKAWPIAGMTEMTLYPEANHTLETASVSEGQTDTLQYAAGAGIAALGWWGDLTPDMVKDDEESLVYDSAPLDETIEIIGRPEVHLNVVADAALFQWTVRLEDVAPDGAVSLVSGALINPSQRLSRLDPVPLTPGEPTPLAARIHFTTWRFQPKHRIRLAISNAQFPMIWPSPYPGSTSLILSQATKLTLPIPPEPTASPIDLPEPEAYDESPDGAHGYSFGPISPAYRDATLGESTYYVTSDCDWRIGESDFNSADSYTWNAYDATPDNAQFSGFRQHVFNIEGRAIDVSGTLTIQSDTANFILDFTKCVRENGKTVAERTWQETIPRNLQ